MSFDKLIADPIRARIRSERTVRVWSLSTLSTSSRRPGSPPLVPGHLLNGGGLDHAVYVDLLESLKRERGDYVAVSLLDQSQLVAATNPNLRWHLLPQAVSGVSEEFRQARG